MTIIAQGRWRARDPNPQQIPKDPDRVTASEIRASMAVKFGGASITDVFFDECAAILSGSLDALDWTQDDQDYLDSQREEHYNDLLHDAGFDENTGADTVLNPQHENTMFLVGCMMMEQDDEA